MSHPVMLEENGLKSKNVTKCLKKVIISDSSIHQSQPSVRGSLWTKYDHRSKGDPPTFLLIFWRFLLLETNPPKHTSRSIQYGMCILSQWQKDPWWKVWWWRWARSWACLLWWWNIKCLANENLQPNHCTRRNPSLLEGKCQKGKGKDPLQMKNYRGITFSSVIAKLFELILLQCLSPVLDLRNCIPEGSIVCSHHLCNTRSCFHTYQRR